MSAPERGTCRNCGRLVPLRKNLTCWKHNDPNGRYCYGSFDAPKEYERESPRMLGRAEPEERTVSARAALLGVPARWRAMGKEERKEALLGGLLLLLSPLIVVGVVGGALAGLFIAGVLAVKFVVWFVAFAIAV